MGRVGFEPTTPAMSRRYLYQARPPAQETSFEFSLDSLNIYSPIMSILSDSTVTCFLFKYSPGFNSKCYQNSSCIAKACTYLQLNMFRAMEEQEQQRKAIEEYERQQQLKRIEYLKGLGISDVLSITQTIGIIGTLLIALYFSSQETNIRAVCRNIC